MSESSLTIYQVTENAITKCLISPEADLKDVAQKLMQLSSQAGAMAITASYLTVMNNYHLSDVDDQNLRIAHKLEKVLDEMNDDQRAELINEMLNAGDLELILSMVRSNASQYSSVVPYLTQEMIAKLFAHDAFAQLHANEDQNENQTRPNYERILELAWTLVCECECSTAVRFFMSDDEYDTPVDNFVLSGKKLLNIFYGMMRNGDENASTFIGKLKDMMRNLPDDDEDED